MTRPKPIPPALYAAFTLSGMAGLTYEVVWSRYLGLFVGHSAYAQILVLGVYLGGAAVGAMAASDVSSRVRRPLAWYAGAEALLGLLGLLFHPIFVAVTDFSYETLFPALPGAAQVGAVRWGLAGLLLLPQAILLGTTFPFMASALVRKDATRPGRGVAVAYMANTLGGAVGVLVAGFWLLAAFGLPGAMAVAAALSFGAALLAWRSIEAESDEVVTEDAPPAHPPRVADGAATASGTPPRLLGPLLGVAFGTAVASFAYEVGWIRMLSLVLGSATHAFELMLSAFILGLAVGAYLIRHRADRTADPIRLLGWMQLLMGLAAVLTLPVYVASFGAMGHLVTALSGREEAFGLFNVARYGLALAVMLPATAFAGATLPLLTAALLRHGAGEGVIGRVYAVNTVGSVVGVGLAGLVALPVLGLKGLILAGAVLDIALGLWLMERAARWRPGGGGLPWKAALGAAAVVAGIGAGVHLDRAVLSSGVFRYGVIPPESARRILFHADGRTATVSAYLHREDRNIVLATNGKPDASMGTRWLETGRDTLRPEPVGRGQDFTTQVLGPLVGLAFMPRAHSEANIGHGSGLSGTALLTSRAVDRLVTIEIEPMMVEGSFSFLPLNGPVFEDPRSTFVFDDAKSFFASRRDRYDLIFAEPSNPWVSGAASLFTREFYARVAAHLAPDGVLTQWVQVYDLDDALFASILAALDATFPSYRGYLVGDADVVIVASSSPLPDPDWSVLASPGVHELTAGMPPFRPEHMASLLLFDEETFRPVLEEGVPANSDFHPILDAGAERARFLGRTAVGLYSMAANRFDLRRMLNEEHRPPLAFAPVPSRGLEPAMSWGRGAWLREALAAGGGIAPEEHPEWGSSLVDLRTFLEPMGSGGRPASWEAWLASFDRAERELHWGTSGWASPIFYGAVQEYLERAEAPPTVRAVVGLLHGAAIFDWNEAATAADALVGRVALGEGWVRPTILVDVATVAYLRTGRPRDALRALDALEPRVGRDAANLRSRLLRTTVERALASASR